MSDKTYRVPATKKEMIEEFQCPGCVAGCDIECGRFKLKEMDGWCRCEGHVLGTTLMGVGHVALGLPKGFNRPGPASLYPPKTMNQLEVRLWSDPDKRMGWNMFNVPVWALVKDGYLFVRTYSPRTNRGTVDVIKGGTLDMVPNALNIEPHLDDMD